MEMEFPAFFESVFLLRVTLSLEPDEKSSSSAPDLTPKKSVHIDSVEMVNYNV